MYPNSLFTLFGKYSVTLYDICMVIAVIAALVVARVYAGILKIPAKLRNWGIILAAFSILAGFGFAALFQATYNYIENPEAGFKLGGGITFFGGLIGGAAFFLLFWFTLVRKVCGRQALDLFPKVLGIAACCIAIAHCIGRVGCLMAGCCYGVDAEGSKLGVNTPYEDHKVLPTQLFEAIFLLELFLLLTYTLFRTRLYGIELYMIFYGGFRFVIEYLRDDYRGSFIPGLTPSQAWAALLFIVGVVILIVEIICRRKKKKSSEA